MQINLTTFRTSSSQVLVSRYKENSYSRMKWWMNMAVTWMSAILAFRFEHFGLEYLYVITIKSWIHSFFIVIRFWISIATTYKELSSWKGCNDFAVFLVMVSRGWWILLKRLSNMVLRYIPRRKVGDICAHPSFSRVSRRSCVMGSVHYLYAASKQKEPSYSCIEWRFPV